MSKAAQDAERLADMLHWTWGTQTQLQRYVASLYAEVTPVAGQDPRRRFSLTSFEEHLLVVAAGNLLTACRRSGARRPGLRVSRETVRMLQLLRDAYEHCDTERSKFVAGKGMRGAVAELASIAPHARPWSVVLGPEGPVLAGAVSLRDLHTNLALLESELLEFERSRQVGPASDANEARSATWMTPNER